MLARTHVVQGIVAEEATVNVEPRLPGFRVGAEQRMADAERDLPLDRLDEVFRQTWAARHQEHSVVIDPVQVLDALLEGGGKLQVAGVTVGEQGVATDRRHRTFSRSVTARTVLEPRTAGTRTLVSEEDHFPFHEGVPDESDQLV